MGQNKQHISVENAIEKYVEMLDYEEQVIIAKDAFKAGVEWQKEQDKELIKALGAIAAWPGNLSDEQYTSKTGANDAALRGSMVVAMRAFAIDALKKYNP